MSCKDSGKTARDAFSGHLVRPFWRMRSKKFYASPVKGVYRSEFRTQSRETVPNSGVGQTALSLASR